MLCERCDSPSLYYADRTNHRYLCRSCHEDHLSTQPTAIAPPNPARVEADLFPSYEAAVSASTGVAQLVAVICSHERVDGAEQEQWATDRGVQIKDLIKALEAQRDEALAPFTLPTKTIRGWYKAILDQLEIGKKHLARIIGEGRRRAETAQAAALSHAQPHELAQAVAVLSPKPSGFVEVENWSWDVFDVGSIPPDYFILDTARLDRETRELKGALAVPGVRTTCTKRGHFR